MVGKRHEIDGETYIVSEDVDLQQIDLENMVNKQDFVAIPEILRTQYAQVKPPIVKTPQISVSTQPQERIWFEVTLDVDGELLVYSGVLEDSKVLSQSCVYALKIDRKQAMELMAIFAKIGPEKSCPVSQIRMMYDKDETVVKYESENRLTYFRINDTKNEEPFVDIGFEIGPLEMPE